MTTVSSCIADRGTVVAVNFGHWGGPIVRGCVVKSPSGYQLLRQVGFTTAGDQHDGTSFICRLGDGVFHHGTQYPTAAQEACVNTPPASAYWSYWTAGPDSNTWSYSTVGAQTDVPKAGGVEYWTFGGATGSGTPAITPNALRASATVPSIVDADHTLLKASSSSAGPFVIGICLVLVLLGAAGWTTWRRRQYQ